MIRLSFDIRRLIILAVCVLAFTTTAAGHDIGPDFRNSSYPWSGPPSWSERLEWLHISSSKTVRLTNGRWADPSQSEESANGTASFAGLTLESVTWADVTGEGRDDAIVVIRYDTGGTQFSYFVYLYSMRAGRPHLLGCFHAGDVPILDFIEYMHRTKSWSWNSSTLPSEPAIAAPQVSFAPGIVGNGISARLQARPNLAHRRPRPEFRFHRLDSINSGVYFHSREL